MLHPCFENADFMLVFTGECKMAAVIHGWAALLETIKHEYTNDDEARAEVIRAMSDADAWVDDDWGVPWNYSEPTGEIGYMDITRINARHVPGDGLHGIEQD